MKNGHFVSAVVFVWSTCGSQSHGLKSSVRQEKPRGKPHLKTRITTVFVQSQSHTHGLTKAAIVTEKQSHNIKRRPCTSNKYYRVCIVHRFWSTRSIYMAASAKPETCCHLLRLWASCLKSRGWLFCLRKMVCRKSITSAYKMSRGLESFYCVIEGVLSELVPQSAGALLQDISIFHYRKKKMFVGGSAALVSQPPILLFPHVQSTW